MKLKFHAINTLLIFACSCTSNIKNNSVNEELEIKQIEYQDVFNDFNILYNDALLETNKDLRIIKFAKAEANLLDSAMVIPLSSFDCYYKVTRLVPFLTSPITLNNDNLNLKYQLAVNEIINQDDYNNIENLYNLALKNQNEFNIIDYLLKNNFTLNKNITIPFFTGFFDNLNPLEISTIENNYIIRNCFASLFTYDIFGNLVNELAKSYTISNDYKTYNIVLKDNLKYVNYQNEIIDNIKAIDYVNGFKQYLLTNPNNLFDIVNAKEYIDKKCNFDEVGFKVIDDLTFQINLNNSNYDFINNLTNICFQPIKDQINFEYDNLENILFTGAFVVNKFLDNQVVITKNKKYYDAKKVNLDSITFINDNNDENTLTNFKENKYSEISFLENDPIYLMITNDKQLSNKIIYSPLSDITNFGILNLNKINCQINTKNALTNINFRKAIVHAFDKKTYYKSSFPLDMSSFILRNTLTPYYYEKLENDITFLDKTYQKNISYGDIVASFLKIDNLNDHKDCFYDLNLANKYLNKYYEEVGNNNIVTLDILTIANSTLFSRIKSFKNIIENNLNHKVIINVIECENQFSYFKRINDLEYDILLDEAWIGSLKTPKSYLEIFTFEYSDNILKYYGFSSK